MQALVLAAALSHEVYGYLPYWSPSAPIRYDLVSTVAFFGADLASTGQVTNWHGWNGPIGQDLRDTAHANGARVDLVMICFDSAAIHAAITTNRATTIASILDGVAMGADGVNLDFEGVGAADRDAMVSFVTDLRAALPTSARLSLAMPAVDWSDTWDYAGIADQADQLMIMAYDYHWSSGSPGPVSPLSDGGVWNYHTVTWTIDAYVTEVGAARADKLILGLPLYGYDWPTVDATVPGMARGAADSVVYSQAELDAVAAGRMWDVASQTPYYLRQDADGWHQIFYDDAESLALKMDLVAANGLGGIGLWALGYDSDTFWPVVDEHFGVDPAPDAGPVEMPDAGPTTMEEGVDGGCGCRAGGRRALGGTGATALFLLLCLGRTARRARNRALRPRSSRRPPSR